ncbi:acid-sensing ion channel 1C-like isoform X2 [Phyllobates terribilis]|uniref:acid-sensing ion channel 1C-like isoform X2 n=1 Tax=Phyllobates terribilis TaxID=111132 RepID=UPI003CCAF05D
MDILKPPPDEEEEQNEKASDLTVFASNSTLHGISHVFLPGGVTPRRVFWACAFLSSLSCFLFQVADRIIYYSQYHHVTTLDEMESSLMTFPAITICNYNKFRLSRMTTRDVDNMGEILGLQNHMDELKNVIQNVTDPDTPFSLKEFYERTGHNIEDMILECRYRNQECGPSNFSVKENVTSTDLHCPFKGIEESKLSVNRKIVREYLANINEFKSPGPDELHPRVLKEIVEEILEPLSIIFENSWRTGEVPEDWRRANVVPIFKKGKKVDPGNYRPEYTSNGKCYTFNSGKEGFELLYTLKGGTGNGLELMLDIQQNEYIPVFEDTADSFLEAGVKVQIHSQDEPPDIGQLGFGVAPGFQTFVSCQQQNLSYLPPPWGDCKDTPFTSPYFNKYSISACRINCETRLILEACGCRLVYMPGNETICEQENDIICAEDTLRKIETSSNVEKPLCECQTPCSMVRFGKELSMVKIPSKSASKFMAMKYNRTEEYIKENILVLDIFFEALNYETIEQKKAYEVAGLLGDIGGQMGLFIGASILTILEIIDYLYEVFRDKVFSYLKKRKNAQSKESELDSWPSLRGAPYCPKCSPHQLPRHQAVGSIREFAC